MLSILSIICPCKNVTEKQLFMKLIAPTYIYFKDPNYADHRKCTYVYVYCVIYVLTFPSIETEFDTFPATTPYNYHQTEN